MSTTKVVTGLVRFSYAKVFTPDEKDEKYSVSLIIPKTDTATIAKINAAIAAAKEAGKTSKFGGKIPAGLKTPLRDGDEERDDDAYKGCYFINAKSNRQPGVVDAQLNPIIDKAEFYSGCYGRASIDFYAYNTETKGIACALNNVQKIKDGEALGSVASKPEDDFGDGFSAFNDPLLA